MKRSRSAVAIGVVVAAAFVSSSIAAQENATPPAPPETQEPAPRVVFDTAYGSIEVELDVEIAPRHCAQILRLVQEGFYDGTTFHRVVPGYLIQGGDPNSRDDDPADDGYGGLEDQRLSPEFSDRPFQRGSVGMARDYRLDGASCQFFIALGRASHLDGRETLIGRVRRGMEVADQIAAVATDSRGRPLEAVRIRAWVVGIASRPGSDR